MPTKALMLIFALVAAGSIGAQALLSHPAISAAGSTRARLGAGFAPDVPATKTTATPTPTQQFVPTSTATPTSTIPPPPATATPTAIPTQPPPPPTATSTAIPTQPAPPPTATPTKQVPPPTPTSPPPSPTSSPTPTGTSSPQTGTYVGLGDSYSSGQGAGNYGQASTDWDINPECAQSANAYPSLLGALLMTAKTPAWNFVFRACSGAIDPNVANPGKPQEQTVKEKVVKPKFTQLEPNLPADTRLVTISVGGNDVGFAPIAAKCVVAVHDKATAEEVKKAVEAKAAVDICKKDGKMVFDKGEALLTKSTEKDYPTLPDLYEEIVKEAPAAQIRVVLYPPIFAPVENPCLLGHAVLNSSYVSDRDIWIGSEQIKFINGLEKDLNETITAAVNGLKNPNVKLVDPTSVDGKNLFENRSLCAKDGTPAFNAVVFVKGTKVSSDSIHPNAAGQQLLFQAVKSTISSLLP